MPRILFIVPYPARHAPSQRFRVELFEPVLQAAGIDYTLAPFMDVHTWNVLYKQGSAIQKAWGIVKGYLKRLKTVLWDVPRYDYIFVHREAAPLGPAFFEWIIARLWRKKLIYDFDDAIWIPNTSAENKMAAWLKSFGKVKRICRMAYKVAAGNDFLCNYAAQYNNNVVRIPTCVDMQRMHNKTKEHKDGKVVIGWTGSHFPLFYLDPLIPLLQELQQELDFTLLIIANKKPDLPLHDWQYIPWNEASEITDLLQMDIGLMPLEADPWSEGKCGFKLIQYLSLAIPALASPVGVNKIIIEDGVNGYLCNTDAEWKQHIKELIADMASRKRMGLAGQQKMAHEYSLRSQQQNFLDLFE